MFRGLFQDFRYSLRILSRTPGFTVVSIASLAIAMATNFLVFGFASSYFLQRLPVKDPQTVVRISWGEFSTVDQTTYDVLRKDNRTLSGIAAFRTGAASLRSGDSVQVVIEHCVTGNYFLMLGVSAQVGRMIESADDDPSRPATVVLSDRFWRRQFSGRADVLGRSLIIRSTPHQIIGVAKAGFNGTAEPVLPDVWTSSGPEGLRVGLKVLGRLRSGISTTQAQADLNRLNVESGAIRRRYPVRVAAARRLEETTTKAAAPLLLLIGILASLLLLIVCVNVGTLLIARAIERHMELGTRLALGATRWRLLRQTTTENFLLAAFGCAVAVPLSVLGSRLLVTAISDRAVVTLILQPPLDLRFWIFAGTIVVVTTVLFSAAPTFISASVTRVTVARAGLTSSRYSSRLREWLVITEIGMTSLLLITAGVFVDNAWRSLTSDPGFATQRVYVGYVPLYAVTSANQLGKAWSAEALEYETLLERLTHNPAIASISVAGGVPIAAPSNNRVLIKANEKNEAISASTETISTGYFRTLGIQLIVGRDFEPSDKKATPGVVIINRSLARRLWPTANPIGQQILITTPGGVTPLSVIGVVSDSKYASLTESSPLMLYRHIPQSNPLRSLALLVRPASDPAEAEKQIAKVLHGLNPNWPITDFMTLKRAVEFGILPITIATWASVGLGSTALLLVVLSIYGTIAYLTLRRTKEFSIRLAMGAWPTMIRSLVTRQAILWAVVGLALGSVFALLIFNLPITREYFEEPSAMIFIGVAVLVLLVTYCAAYIPVRAASLADPSQGLREQ